MPTSSSDSQPFVTEPAGEAWQHAPTRGMWWRGFGLNWTVALVGLAVVAWSAIAVVNDPTGIGLGVVLIAGCLGGIAQRGLGVRSGIAWARLLALLKATPWRSSRVELYSRHADQRPPHLVRLSDLPDVGPALNSLGWARHTTLLLGLREERVWVLVANGYVRLVAAPGPSHPVVAPCHPTERLGKTSGTESGRVPAEMGAVAGIGWARHGGSGICGYWRVA